MRTVEEQTNEERYQKWIEENGEYLRRFTKEYVASCIEKYFYEISHEEWQRINRAHLYAELKDLVPPMVQYYSPQRSSERRYTNYYI